MACEVISKFYNDLWAINILWWAFFVKYRPANHSNHKLLEEVFYFVFKSYNILPNLRLH